jgi:hypothetical protein
VSWVVPAPSIRGIKGADSLTEARYGVAESKIP